MIQVGATLAVVLSRLYTQAANTKRLTARGILTPQPPFKFQKSLGLIREFAPTRAEQHIGEQLLTRALIVRGQLCGFDEIDGLPPS